MVRLWAGLVALLMISLAHSQEEGVQCKTTAKADIVLVVDGSWSYGRINFRKVLNFITRIVSVFDIGPERVQIGLVQYSADPRTEWYLNTHPNKTSLLQAVANVPYKGGSTLTGLALSHAQQDVFNANGGLRCDARKICVLITDGMSKDNVIVRSRNLRDSGVEVYAIGVKNADETELRFIASDPDDLHMFNVKDFHFLPNIEDQLRVNLCNSVKDSDLQVMDEKVTSLRVRWKEAEGATGYTLVYRALNGSTAQQERELRVGLVNSVVLTQLTPSTAYRIQLFVLLRETDGVTGAAVAEPLEEA